MFPLTFGSTKIRSRVTAATLNPQLSTLNSQLPTLNSQLSTLNSQLSTLNSQLSILLMAEHKAEIATRSCGFKQGAIVNSHHPVDLESEMHTGSQAEISTYIG